MSLFERTKYAEGFIRRYLSDIEREFTKFKKYGTWTLNSEAYGGELIKPKIFLGEDGLEYRSYIMMTLDRLAKTDPFKVVVVSPEPFYEQLTKDLGNFVDSLKKSLDEQARNSFVSEVRAGKLVKLPDRHYFTLEERTSTSTDK